MATYQSGPYVIQTLACGLIAQF